MGNVRLPVPQHNWSEAFLLFAQGQELSTIAETMAIPLSTLEVTARKHQWAALAARLKAPEPAGAVKADLDVIKANMAKNHEIACKLREDLVMVVDRLLETKGEGMIERNWHNRGAIVSKAVPFGPQDRVALATYCKLIADLTLTTLGVKPAGDGGAQTPSESAGAAPSITIILPGVISKPRNELEQRDLRENVTLDLRPANAQLTVGPSSESAEVPQA